MVAQPPATQPQFISRVINTETKNEKEIQETNKKVRRDHLLLVGSGGGGF